MINCPKCRMSNFSQDPVCAYCKTPLAGVPEVPLEPTLPQVVAPLAPVTALDPGVDLRKPVLAPVELPEAAPTEAEAPARFDLWKRPPVALEPAEEEAAAAEEEETAEPETERLFDASVDRRHAALCSLFIPGSGQVLKGQPERGFCFLVLLVLSYGFFQSTVISGGVWLCVVFDAFLKKADDEDYSPTIFRTIRVILAQNFPFKEPLEPEGPR